MYGISNIEIVSSWTIKDDDQVKFGIYFTKQIRLQNSNNLVFTNKTGAVVLLVQVNS